MLATEFLAGKRFKLWEYNPSQRNAVFRHSHNPKPSHNIDLTFWEVQCMNMPIHCDEITIQAEPFDGHYQKFLIHTNGALYDVIAVSFMVTRLDGPYFAPAFVGADLSSTALLYSYHRGNESDWEIE